MTGAEFYIVRHLDSTSKYEHLFPFNSLSSLIMEFFPESRKRIPETFHGERGSSLAMPIYGGSLSNVSRNSPFPTNPIGASLWNFCFVPSFDIPLMGITILAFQFYPK